MWRIAMRGLAARKVRLGATALAIALGVTFTVAVLVVSDTLQRTYTGLFSEVVGGAQLVVQSPKQFGGSSTPRARFPAGVVVQVQSTEGVQQAQGVVRGSAQFVSRTGTPIINGAAPAIGLSWPDLGAASPLQVASGTAPSGPDEVAMDVKTAQKNKFAVGDQVQVVTTGAAKSFKISALLSLGGRTDLGGVTVAAFDTPTAQRLFGAGDAYDAVFVVTAPNASVPAVQRALQAQFPMFEVTPATSFADQVAAPVRIAIGLLTDALLGFAAIGLLVGSFIVFNTFAVLVSQRTRELGMLRALGGAPGQLFRSVIAEAAIVGAVAGAVGIGLGYLAALGVVAALPSAGLVIPKVELVFTTRTALVAVAVGVGVTVVAAAIPAFRAAYAPPIESLAEHTREHARVRPRRVITGIVLALGAAASIAAAFGFARDQLVWSIAAVGIGAAAALAAVVVLGPVIFRPLVRFAGGWIPRRAVVAHLADENARRNPRRTSATALALVVGAALVCLSAVLVTSFQTSLERGINDGLEADLVLTGQQFRGFSVEAAEEVSKLSGVQRTSGIRFSDAQVQGVTERVAGMEQLGAGLDDLVNLDVVDGDVATLDDDSILVYQDALPGVRAGQTVEFRLLGAPPRPLRVAAVYRNRQFTGLVPISFVITQTAFDIVYSGSEQDTYALVRSTGDTAGTKAQIDQLLRNRFPTVSVLTKDEFLAQQQQPVQIVQRVLGALLVLSVIIALLGVLNTLLLAVYERTREIGLLRTVGMQRSQVFRMVCGESLLISLAGCVVGVALGLLWAWSLIAVLRREGLTSFSVPVLGLVVMVVGGSVAGVVAALAPAVRAARLEVLEAVAEE